MVEVRNSLNLDRLATMDVTINIENTQAFLNDSTLVEDYTDIEKPLRRNMQLDSVTGNATVTKPEFLRESSSTSSFDIIHFHEQEQEHLYEEFSELEISFSETEIDTDSEVALSETETESEDSEEQVSIEDDEEEYQHLPPPTELDPSKLYALYAFSGLDPSHCQLEQDESCTLLNDEDVYWWLVRRCRDGAIGFAPAELLETFPERLARLNSWKNENLVLHNEVTSQLKDYKKSNKSVSFNDVICYADAVQIVEDIVRDRLSKVNESGNETNSETLSPTDEIITPMDHETEIQKTSPIMSLSSVNSSDDFKDSISTELLATENYVTDSIDRIPRKQTGTLHPFIFASYNPIFSQIDDLISRVDQLV